MADLVEKPIVKPVKVVEKPDHLHDILVDHMTHVYEVLDRHEASPRPGDTELRSRITARLKALKK